MTTTLAWTAASWVALIAVLVVANYRGRRNLARQRANRVHPAAIPTRLAVDWDQLQTAVDLARRDFRETA